MIELFDTLRTCAHVRALGTQGIGEGPTMDYKERISFTEQGTLTAGSKKELARDVSALGRSQEGGRAEVQITYRFGPPPGSDAESYSGSSMPGFKKGSLS